MTQPRHRPERQSFVVHVGAASAPATLPEWWGSLDSGVEARALRFSEDGGNWIEEGALPHALLAAGARFSGVAGVMDFEGLKSPVLQVGQRVLLKPDAQPQDRFAIAVWTGDDRQQVGFLPSDVAAEVMALSMRDRVGFGGFVAHEVRDAASEERRDVTILIGPGVVWAEPDSGGA
jgi:HIRAN domain